MPTEIEMLRASMRQAQVYGKGQYLEEGVHELEIIKVKHQRTLVEGAAKESLIAEFKVLSSSNPTHQVGSTRSYVENLVNTGWLSRFKAFMIAAIGVDPEGKVPTEAEEATSDMYVALRSDEERVKLGLPENFMAGRRVRCEGMAGKSKKGGPVTNKKWLPLAAPASPAGA